MKKIYWIFGIFCLVAVIQIAAPVSMIVKRENILRHGEQFKFKTAPVDPYDAFRGRFVALLIEERTVPIPDSIYKKRQEIRFGQKVFATLEKDENGFGRFASISLTRPEGKHYVKTRLYEFEKDKVRLDLPFDRYYMDENLAPLAESVYREHSREEKHDAYVTVRIKSGYAALEELYIDGIPIKEFILNK